MRVFIAWSGSRSKAIAEILRRWVHKALPSSEPYMSTIDSLPGRDWLADVAQHLDGTNVGIMCYTRENLRSEWMLFEAGAIAKEVENHRLIPFLFDDLSPEHLPEPLRKYTASKVDRTGFKDVIEAIFQCTNGSMADDTQKLIDTHWPVLELQLQAIPLAAITSPIEGIWVDTIEPSHHMGILKIASTTNGLSIIGMEVDKAGEHVKSWESIAAGHKETRLDYVYESELRGSSEFIKGVTALSFRAPRNDHGTKIYCLYSGYYVDLFRKGNKLIPEKGDLRGTRINSEEAPALFEERDLKALVQKYRESQGQG